MEILPFLGEKVHVRKVVAKIIPRVISVVHQSLLAMASFGRTRVSLSVSFHNSRIFLNYTKKGNLKRQLSNCDSQNKGSVNLNKILESSANVNKTNSQACNFRIRRTNAREDCSLQSNLKNEITTAQVVRQISILYKKNRQIMSFPTI